MEKSSYSKILLIFISLLFGVLIRLFLVSKIAVGDLLAYGEWGEMMLKVGAKNLYVIEHEWRFSGPNYFPFAMWIFAGLTWLNEHRYFLAIWHNLIKIPPAIFIIYFYKYGQILLLKLPSIIADVFLAILTYKVIWGITKDFKKSILGLAFYILNPVTIFLSGMWGQTDSFVALLGLVSFILLEKGSIFSAPLMFLSLYFKPSWIIFLPFYLFVVWKNKINFSKLLIGGIISVILFLVITHPFSGNNLGSFMLILKDKISFPLGGFPKVSVSAFNFYTIFYKIDRTFANPFLQFISLFFFTYFNYLAFKGYNSKNSISLYSGILLIGMGSFLFTLSMLERYFFPAFVPLVIIAFVDFKKLKEIIFLNLILFLNVFYAFYRRKYDGVDHPFTNFNFLGIRILSVLLVGLFLKVYIWGERQNH